MLNRKLNWRMIVAVAVALGTTAATGLAYAEEQTLEEVVVTARKRQENLQDVNSAVSALSSADLAKRFDTDLRSFANAAPNVQIDDLQQGPGSPAAIAIRGVGTTDVEKSFDPATGVVVDGIFIGVNSGAMIKAVDLESVEVLRGPQGTLFGRNSIAGVINVTRSQPSTDAVAGTVRLGYGNYNDLQADGYVNLPVTDSFALKLGAAKRERDGYYYDTTVGKDVGAQDYKSISPSFLWKVRDGLEVTYRFDKSWQRQDTDIQLNLAQPGQVWCFYYQQCAQSVTSPQSGDRYVTLSNTAPEPAYFNTDMHTLHVAWNVAQGYKLDYLFGYFKTKEDAFQDWDGTPLDLYSTLRPASYYQHSHELRLTYSGDGPLSYTVGLYSWNSGYRIDLTSYIGFVDFLYGYPAGTQFTVLQTVQQKTDSQAAFFEGDYKFSDAWTLNVGGRYTRDKKTSGLIDPGMPELATLGSLDNPFEKTWSQFTPKLSLKYRFSRDLMVYGLYSGGFRAGGFSGRPGTYDAASTAYNPETVDNFELGWKAEFLNRRLRLNGAVFVMKYKDKQEEESVPTNVGTGQQTLVLNASSATIKGIELDFAANIYAGFTVSGNLGILQANYDKLIDPITGTDLSHLHLRRSPPVTATVSPAYEWALGKGTASAQVDYHYIGPEELTFLNSPQGSNAHQDVLDASLNYVIDRTRISLYGLNLTGEDAWTQAYDVGTSVGFAGLWTYATPRAPLTYGVRITQTF
jgi:iron complex outermembrane receptor protein